MKTIVIALVIAILIALSWEWYQSEQRLDMDNLGSYKTENSNDAEMVASGSLEGTIR